MKIKQTFLIFFLLSISTLVWAQNPTPLKFNYSTTAINKLGKPIISSTIGVQISILKKSPSGTSVYTENHYINTDETGQFSFVIGDGSSKIGAIKSINWLSDDYFLKLSIDENGTNKFLPHSVIQLLIVPYDLSVKKMEALEDTTTTVSDFKHYLGEQFGGGVIFELWKDTLGVEHGHIVDVIDLSSSYVWSNVNQEAIGRSAENPTDGLTNSNSILAQKGHTKSAAALCLNSTNGGHTDWYLPSIKELNALWSNYFVVEKTLAQISGANQLLKGSYWSSTEYLEFTAWYFYFDEGDSYGNDNKDAAYRVRAIRSF